MTFSSSETAYAPLTARQVLDRSTGLRLLIEASNCAEEASPRLRLRPRPHVFCVCEIAGVDTLLPHENAPLEADA